MKYSCTKLSIVHLALLYSLLPCLSSADEREKNNDIKEIDKAFIKLSSSFFLHHLTAPSKYTSILELQKKVEKLQADNNNIESLKLITSNTSLIKKNIEHKSIFYFISILLNNNEWYSAKLLLKYIEEEADRSLISNIKFLFAKYFYEKDNYDKALSYITNTINDLSFKDGQYALIMTGVILQNKKKHREALPYYEKVPTTSIYYRYAQLNKAIVFIRQGWWTDAHITINNALKIKPTNQQNTLDKELTNRLYLVIGYSFLQQEYFREARNSFRNIEKESIYANRALLGIALAAANQDDNLGALNILNILQDKKLNSLSVEETYLLLPYIYERIGQYKTAAASYSIALAFYQKRIQQLQATLNRLTKNKVPRYSLSDNDIETPNNNIKLLKGNINRLLTYKKSTNNKTLIAKINTIILIHKNKLIRLFREAINARIYFLQSYKNQSQFGIARLYDSSKNKK